MSQAARNMYSPSVVARKRTAKPLRGERQQTGNLNVYTHAERARTGNLDVYSQANRESTVLAEQTVSSSAADGAAPHPAATENSLLHHTQAANHDSAGKRTLPLKFSERLATVPTPYVLLVAAVGVGALATALYMAADGTAEPQLAQSVDVPSNGSADVPVLEAADQSSAQAANLPPIDQGAGDNSQNGDPAIDVTATRGVVTGAMTSADIAENTASNTTSRVENASAQQATDESARPAINEYQLEINRLNEENRSLQARLDQVATETLELNEELLDLELTMVQTQSVPETRVVYNFVNVPLGENPSSVPVGSQRAAEITEQFSGSEDSYEAEGFVGTEEVAEPDQYVETEYFVEPDPNFANERYEEPEEYLEELEDPAYTDQFEYVDVPEEPAYVDQYADDMEVLLGPDQELQANPNYSPNAESDQYDAYGNPLIDADSQNARPSPNIQFPPLPDES